MAYFYLTEKRGYSFYTDLQLKGRKNLRGFFLCRKAEEESGLTTTTRQRKKTAKISSI